MGVCQEKARGWSMTEEPKKILPTKKQRELLTFIDEFIKEHGYSPSFRETMAALNYNSVATVALHVNNLIKRGHLRKRDHSARSLEVVNSDEPAKLKSNAVAPSEEKWLVEKVEYFFNDLESGGAVEQKSLDELYVLIGALKVLGLDGAAQSFIPRLSELKRRLR
jgi:repressor LexA